MKIKKHNFIVSVAVIVLLVFVNPVVASDEYCCSSHPSLLSKGEKMVFDAVILRPVGLVTTVAGAAIYTVSLPFSLLGGNENEAREYLINDPARYTFKRPLGDLDY